MGKLSVLIFSLFIIVLFLGGYITYLTVSTSPPSVSVPVTPQITKKPNGVTPTSLQRPVGGMRYTVSGFSPSRLRFRSGSGIDFIISNLSPKAITVESDTPELSIGSLAAGASKTITIYKIGIYSFHNKANPSQKATFEIIP